MYVAITGRGKARVIQFCEQHRIPGSKKKKTIVIKTIGNYEKLFEENPNIITELKAEAKQLTLLKKEEKKQSEILCQATTNKLVRFGHSILKKIWSQLELSDFLISHFGEKEGKKLSNILFSLVVYRLGSSYKTFRSNRKIPFLNVSSISSEEFYKTLEKLASIQENLQKHLSHFFEQQSNHNISYGYYHISYYQYHPYFKSLQKGNSFQKDSYSFAMLLLFDKHGIPIAHHLLEDFSSCETILQHWKQEKNLSKIISLSPEIKTPEGGYFLHTIAFESLSKKIQKKILENHSWYILEKDENTEEILKKELHFPASEHEKYYIQWSKKQAFKDYLTGAKNHGYFCSWTNDTDLKDIEILNIFEHIWKIEDKFLITNVHFEKNHIQGHFMLCFLCLSIVRYFQFLLSGDEEKQIVPMIYVNKAISNPMILEEKTDQFHSVIPIHLTNSYLKLSKTLGLNPLHKKMTAKEFEEVTSFSLED